MSIWSDQELTEKVIDVLGSVPLHDELHHFGRPFMSAYQLAIGVERRFPGTAAALGKPVGGAGIGQHNSLAQYVANELSKQIHAQGVGHPVEGAFLSNVDVQAISYLGTNGQPITSSLTGTGFDLSLFRLR